MDKGHYPLEEMKMNQRDVLSKETFWTWIVAIELFYGLTVLPVCTYIFVHFFHFALWASIEALTTRLTVAFLIIPLVVWKTLDDSDEELKSSTRQAQKVMLYGNIVGLSYLLWKRVIVLLPEMFGFMWEGSFPEDTE